MVRAALTCGLLLSLGCGSDPANPVDAAAVTMPDSAPPDCSDGNSCTTDRWDGTQCVHDPMPNCCGNGTVETGESCDDGNQLDGDGCSHACLHERALIWKSATLLDGTQGCNLTGNSDPSHVDNAFGGAMNSTARNFYSNVMTQENLQGCDKVDLWLFVGPDPTMTTQPFAFGFALGHDPDGNLQNNFDGTQAFTIEPESLDGSSRLLLPFSGSVAAMDARIGPANIHYPFLWCLTTPLEYVMVDYSRLQIRGTITTDANGPTELDGMFCGARAASSWNHFDNDSGMGGRKVLDLIVLGADFLGFHGAPTQPDIDVDGDGLEVFMDTDGDNNIDLCIDGNGAQIQGVDCPDDPRIVDAYSEAWSIQAVRAGLGGPSH